MTISQMEILSCLVDRYDYREEPVTLDEVAMIVDADITTVRKHFDQFESNYLVKAVGDGYRPTMTARELLDLDFDEDTFFILDPQPQC